MSETLELPALDGRDPLGFLAALGIMRLLSDEGEEVGLSFSEETAVARLHGRFTTHDEVVAVLRDVVDRIPDGGSLPGVKASFPVPMGRGSDPMRVNPRDSYRGFVAKVREESGADAVAWVRVFVTDLARDDGGRAALTPFAALSAKMNVRTFCANPANAVRRDPETLREALIGWRRVPGFTGEYLDHRAQRSAADDPAGVASTAGVPGATWLAIMALPLFRLGGDGRRVSATLWQSAPRQPALMVWPLWRQRLDVHAVMALLEHPAVAVQVTDGVATVDATTWPELGVLGVFSVCAARRLAINDYARPLAPQPVRMGS